MASTIIFMLPVLSAVIATYATLVATRRRQLWIVIAASPLVVFLLISFTPGWWFWIGALRHDSHSELMLGHYYNSRMGYLLTNMEKRDQWWLESARHGNIEAMYHVGYHSIRGSSALIPRDFNKARILLEKSLQAGLTDAADGLRSLERYEAYMKKRNGLEEGTGVRSR